MHSHFPFLLACASTATASITHCLTTHSVPYITNLSSTWPALQRPYNLRLSYEPAIITLPTTCQHVSDSVTCAGKAGLKVQAKGGGHSYASFSSGGRDGGVVVDMAGFQGVVVDGRTYIAQIGAGARLGNIALAIYDQGHRALPHGTCPGVGIGGHALHGGFGLSSRAWGLTLDTIVALSVILANGSEITCTSTSHPDIFYAMRGAGDSFGIVTYFYLQTLPAPDSVLFWSASLAAALDDVDVTTETFGKVQDFVVESGVVTENMSLGMYVDSGGSWSVSGWCIECDVSTFSNTKLPTLLRSLPIPYPSPSITQQSWIAALENLAAPQPLAQPLARENYTLHDTFYAKSVVVHEDTPLTPASIRSFFTYIKAHQGGLPFFSIINLYGGSGSAINQPSPSSSAYSDRSALWVVQNYGYTSDSLPPFDEAIIGLVDGLNDAITMPEPEGNFTAYLNYVDSGLGAREAAEVYYGGATYDRLLAIKRVVDPGFVFWNPQGIGNSGPLPER